MYVPICKINQKLCRVHSYMWSTTNGGEIHHCFRGSSKVQGASSTQKNQFVKLAKEPTWRLMYCSHHCLASLWNETNWVYIYLQQIQTFSVQTFSTFAIFCRIWPIRSAVVESRPDVGSSKKSSDGLRRISLPIQTLFLSPPEIPLTNVPPINVSWHLKHIY